MALSALLLVSGCGGSGGDNRAAPRSAGSFTVEDPGTIHAHGVGANPADGAVFVATHTGLFRFAPGQDEGERVAGRYQDTMAFTVLGPDHFIGSGHPDAREDLPPYLGLIESRDAGRSWEPVSLAGEVDFHVLEAAGETVYGFGSDWKTREAVFLASDDGGRSWTGRQAPEALMGLAIDPEHPERMVASGTKALYRSSDGGMTWRTVAGRPGLLTWPAPEQLHVADAQGKVHLSEDAGARWRTTGDVDGAIAAFDSGREGELLAVLHDGTLKRSEDAGRTWNVRARP